MRKAHYGGIYNLEVPRDLERVVVLSSHEALRGER